MMPRLSSVDAESEGSLLNDAISSNAVVDGKETSWTKKWVNRGGIRQLLLGQWLSVLMAGTGITSTYLADMCFKAPTFQSLGNYVMLAAIFVPVSLFSQLHDDNSAPPPKGRCFLLKPTWWPFILLALIDIEANYLVVLAFEYVISFFSFTFSEYSRTQPSNTDTQASRVSCFWTVSRFRVSLYSPTFS